MKAERVPGLPRAAIGEGVIWCDRTARLWWVDIGRSRLHRSDPFTGVDEQWDMPSRIGCVALTAGPEVVVALATGLHVFDPNGGALSHLTDLPGQAPSFRPNDGAVSRAGLFFVGTVATDPAARAEPAGRVVSYGTNGGAEHLDGLHVANGLAFSPDDRTAYLSDSWPAVRMIWAFDHEPKTGALSRRRLFFDTTGTAGRPDGACIDAEGCYWMAGVGGGEVLRLTPAGEIDRRIAVPTSHPSKPCFGGHDLRTLFVTSIGAPVCEDASGGSIFAINLPHQGLPETRLAPMTGAVRESRSLQGRGA